MKKSWLKKSWLNCCSNEEKTLKELVLKRKDILERRERVARALRRKVKKDIKNTKNNNYNDCVYVIRHGESNVFKIGKGNPSKRLASMQVGNPALLRIYSSVSLGSASTSIEKYLHKRYEKYKIGGEWFYLSDPIRQSLDNDMSLIEAGLLPDREVPKAEKLSDEDIARILKGNMPNN